jgi:hypothetical protein
MSRELSETTSDAIDLGRLPARMSRLFGAVLADLKIVDCGSLDVLVYCSDDVAGGTGDRRLAGSIDGP